MTSHIKDNTFKSDKYDWCPTGFMPFKITDKLAQDLLWIYATRKAATDIQLSKDLKDVLIYNGYSPPEGVISTSVSAKVEAVLKQWNLDGCTLGKELVEMYLKHSAERHEAEAWGRKPEKLG